MHLIDGIVNRRGRVMTRNEKEQRIQKKDGKAFESYNVEIHETYRNAKYTLSKQTANDISPTGLLKVFEINPSGGRTVIYGEMGWRKP